MTSVGSLSHFFGRSENKVATAGIDYKSTRFHNQLVERHDTANVVSEAIAAQDRKKAFELAKEQQVKKVIK